MIAVEIESVPQPRLVPGPGRPPITTRIGNSRQPSPVTHQAQSQEAARGGQLGGWARQGMRYRRRDLRPAGTHPHPRPKRSSKPAWRMRYICIALGAMGYGFNIRRERNRPVASPSPGWRGLVRLLLLGIALLVLGLLAGYISVVLPTLNRRTISFCSLLYPDSRQRPDHSAKISQAGRVRRCPTCVSHHGCRGTRSPSIGISASMPKTSTPGGGP